MLPTKKVLREVHKKIKPFIHETPVLQSSILNELSGADLYFKCENFQKMGAFKIRGATSAVLSLPESQRRAGVVTHSSGNFGQAVALAAKNLNTKAYIVMPENAPSVKIEAVKNYGGQVIICKPTLEARESEAARIQEQTSATFLHPSNQLEVILGNATATIELLEQEPDLDCLISPIGGGGLIAGTALAAHYFGSGCQIFGSEPKEVDDAYRSFHSGKIETNEKTATIADGLRTTLGDVNFPIIKSLVDDILLVSEAEIVSAMELIWSRMKIIIEPSSAVPFAAIMRNKELFKGKKIGVILSGGNVDFSKIPF